MEYQERKVSISKLDARFHHTKRQINSDSTREYPDFTWLILDSKPTDGETNLLPESSNFKERISLSRLTMEVNQSNPHRFPVTEGAGDFATIEESRGG